jgi:DMSO/TMAO reductase YedYZ molybdopterin-dependent catalytic subunit
MVIPWLGFPLGALLKRVAPTSRAKYVAFTSLLDPDQMPGQRRRLLDWPYNVNPAVDHPRWSQATERRIGDFRRRPTLPFNGYAEHVASLYTGMDLRQKF